MIQLAAGPCRERTAFSTPWTRDGLRKTYIRDGIPPDSLHSDSLHSAFRAETLCKSAQRAPDMVAGWTGRALAREEAEWVWIGAKGVP